MKKKPQVIAYSMGSFTTKVWDLDGLNMQEMGISLINSV